MGNICIRGDNDDGLNYSWDSGENWDYKAAPSDDEFEVTILELRLIQRKWTILTTSKTMKSFTYSLFEKLFVFFPDKHKLLYVADSGDFISSQQWKEHPLFAQHIREVVNSLGTIIKLLDEKEQLRDFLTNIEEFHRCLRGMKKYYVEVFVRIIDESMTSNFGALYTGETKRIFRKILTMVYYKLTWRLLI